MSQDIGRLHRFMTDHDVETVSSYNGIEMAR